MTDRYYRYLILYLVLRENITPFASFTSEFKTTQTILEADGGVVMESLIELN